MATINAQTRDNYAARTGSWLGRAWLKFLRRERQFVTRLGIPARAANALLWIFNLGLIAAALYFFFVIGVVLLALVLAGHLLHAGTTEGEQQPQWGIGLYGYGQYDHKGDRLDPHDPNALP